jgi:hypothetical protein
MSVWVLRELGRASDLLPKAYYLRVFRVLSEGAFNGRSGFLSASKVQESVPTRYATTQAETESTPRVTCGLRPGQSLCGPCWANRAHNPTMPYFSLLIVLCCDIFYHRVGEAEYSGGWLLALISVALSVVGLLILHWGWLGVLLLQAVLFFALSIWNMRSKKRP